MSENAEETVRTSSRPDRQRTALWMLMINAIYIATIAVWIIALWPEPHRFVRLAGNPTGVSFYGWLLAAAVALVYISYTLWAVPSVRSMAVEFSWLKLLGVPLAVLSGVIEEFVFRRLLMDALRDGGQGVALQIVLSALAFAVAHTVWIVFSRNWRILVPVLISTFILGVMLSSVYLTSERVVLPAVLAHIVINLVIEPGLLHSASSRIRDRGVSAGTDNLGVSKTF